MSANDIALRPYEAVVGFSQQGHEVCPFQVYRVPYRVQCYILLLTFSTVMVWMMDLFFPHFK